MLTKFKFWPDVWLLSRDFAVLIGTLWSNSFKVMQKSEGQIPPLTRDLTFYKIRKLNLEDRYEGSG